MISETTFRSRVIAKDDMYYHLSAGKMKKYLFSADVFSVPAEALDESGELRVNGPLLTFFFTKSGDVVLDHRLYLRPGADFMDTRKGRRGIVEKAPAEVDSREEYYNGKEGDPLELKTSFYVSADRQEDTERSPRQFLKILSAIAGAANSRLSVDFRLVVGVKDNGVISGIENEVPDKDEPDFEAMFRNYVWQKTGSRIFSASIGFFWERIGSHKICTLSLSPWNGGLILVSGCQLYVRQGAQTVQYLDGDLVSFIRSNQN